MCPFSHVICKRVVNMTCQAESGSVTFYTSYKSKKKNLIILIVLLYSNHVILSEHLTKKNKYIHF